MMKAQNSWKSALVVCCMLVPLVTAPGNPLPNQNSFVCDFMEYGWVCDDQSVETNNVIMKVVEGVNCYLDNMFGNGTLYIDEYCAAISYDHSKFAESLEYEKNDTLFSACNSTVGEDSKSSSEENKWNWAEGICSITIYDFVLIASAAATAIATVIIAFYTRGAYVVAKDALGEKNAAADLQSKQEIIDAKKHGHRILEIRMQ